MIKQVDKTTGKYSKNHLIRAIHNASGGLRISWWGGVGWGEMNSQEVNGG